MLSLAQSLTLSDFHQMYAIERAYYDPRYITPPQEAFRWYQAYPLSTLAVKEGEMVAGFLNLFPVRQEVFAQILAGTFNEWNPGTLPMNREEKDGVYSCTLHLPEGVYEYRFIIDGCWVMDNENEACTANEFGTRNSILRIK